MRTTVSQRGQTVIPAELRRRYNLEEGSQIEWFDTGSGLRIVPVAADPIGALRGLGKGERLLDRLLLERSRENRR
ncbi:MAG TPA: AbrB/MazE/SpoVT family DNA-binding domain-containing protein [Chloroflexota bacterium]